VTDSVSQLQNTPAHQLAVLHMCKLTRAQCAEGLHFSAFHFMVTVINILLYRLPTGLRVNARGLEKQPNLCTDVPFLNVCPITHNKSFAYLFLGVLKLLLLIMLKVIKNGGCVTI
jgi:hypothetical protein